MSVPNKLCFSGNIKEHPRSEDQVNISHWFGSAILYQGYRNRDNETASLPFIQLAYSSKHLWNRPVRIRNFPHLQFRDFVEGDQSRPWSLDPVNAGKINLGVRSASLSRVPRLSSRTRFDTCKMHLATDGIIAGASALFADGPSLKAILPFWVLKDLADMSTGTECRAQHDYTCG